MSVSNSTVQFALLPPYSTASLPLPGSAFGAQTCTITNVPGTWTMVVNDPNNSCQSAISVEVQQNTVAPNVYAYMNTLTLTCNNPTLIATGASTSTNTYITWEAPNFFSPPSHTIVIGPGTGPPTSSTNLTYANYTVVATNTINACKTTSIITFNQNFKVPVPFVAIGNPSVITCSGNPVFLNWTGTAGGSGIPGAVALLTSWQGPPTQPTVTAGSTYSAYVGGVYTLTVQDSKNGCYGVKTIFVGQNTTPPAGAASYSNTCGGPMIVTPTFTGSTANLSFMWTAPPSGTIAGANNTMSVAVNGFGTYSLTITNNSTQCSRVDTVQVYSCPGIKKNVLATINVNIFPNPSTKNININFDDVPKETQLQIFDLQGKLLLSNYLTEKSNSIFLDLDKGFYNVRISSAGRIIKSEKLLIE